MNHKTKGLIPDLRFPEFSHFEGWGKKSIGEISFSQSSSVALNKLQLKSKGYIVYGADSIVGYINNFEQKEIYISIVKDGSGVGRLNLCEKESSVLGTLAYINSLNKYEYHLIWIFYLLNSINFSSYIKGSGIPHIYFSDFKQEIIGVPKIIEQQKIASCLSSLDEIITAQKEKLELLKNHKKGLMQNLFPQEGEKIPKFRFPEFNKDGDWEEKKLGDMGNFLGGGTPSRIIEKYWDGNIPWISSSDISDNDIHKISISQYINENAIKESATKIIPKGSILFVSRVGVGKLAINNDFELCTSQDFMNFVPNKDLNYFIAYYFIANKTSLQSLSQGTSIKGFSKNDLQDLIIFYPRNIGEQQKIASCLSSLDELISSQTQKLEELQLHKKGLMQGLFPKITD